jgi:PelA/Pel-15E family pectate lyase
MDEPRSMKFPQLTFLAMVLLHIPPLPADPVKQESDVVPYVLPDPLIDSTDKEITKPEAWRAHREKLMAQFSEEMYGRTLLGRPDKLKFRVVEEKPLARGGRATRLRVKVMFEGTETGRSMEMLVYLPNDVTKPVPLFLGLNFDGNYTTTDDTDLPLPTHFAMGLFDNKLPDHKPTEVGRGMHRYEWPVDFILESGFGLATAAYGEIEPDQDGTWKQGVRGLASEPGVGDWGAVGAWAWGLSRALDYLETNDRLDGKRVVLTGFSRLGKAALWAGAQDERFAGVVSNCSGAGGLALSKRIFGETPADLTKRFPHWFAKNYAKYAEKESTMPFDQHQLAACIAPRPLLGVSGLTDLWSDPKGEFLALKAASPVYELVAKRGLKAQEWPKPGKLVNGLLGYYLHEGGHDVVLEDWRAMLNWAESNIGGTEAIVYASERYARRMASLPPQEKSAWKAYFTRSDGLRRRHDEILSEETKAAKLKQPTPAPESGGEVDLPEKPTGTEDELKLAQTLVSWQVPAGGWSKHVDYRAGARQPGMAWTSQSDAAHYAGTFDNRATTKQLLFLAQLQSVHPDDLVMASVERGIDYILNAQFPNGGWPQGYPLEGGYHDAITLNDGAMPHVIETLQSIVLGKDGFAWVDDARKQSCKQALTAGVNAILRLQVKVAEQPTIWAAQYDIITMQPVAARGFEVAALSGGESVEVIRTLFKMRPVTPELTASVESACAWFASHPLPDGIGSGKGLEWARFIDLKSLAPLFPGKNDGRCYASLAELKKHNPTGYDYTVTKPADLPKWLAKWRKTVAK